MKWIAMIAVCVIGAFTYQYMPEAWHYLYGFLFGTAAQTALRIFD